MATQAINPESNNPIHDAGDTAAVRGAKTTVQGFLGAIVGLGAVIWAVPGVPDAVVNYVTGNLLTLALSVGIPAGIIALVQNVLRKDVKNF